MLQAKDHLVGEREHSLQAELAVAVREDVLNCMDLVAQLV